MVIDRVQIAAIVTSLVLLVVVVELVRRRKLVEEYSIIWIIGALMLLVSSVWRGVLDTAAGLLGVYYPPSLVLMGLVLLVFVALLGLSVILSRQQRQIESLTEESAVLAAEIRDLRTRHGEVPRPPQDSPRPETTAQEISTSLRHRREPTGQRPASEAETVGDI